MSCSSEWEQSPGLWNELQLSLWGSLPTWAQQICKFKIMIMPYNGVPHTVCKHHIIIVVTVLAGFFCGSFSFHIWASDCLSCLLCVLCSAHTPVMSSPALTVCHALVPSAASRCTIFKHRMFLCSKKPEFTKCFAWMTKWVIPSLSMKPLFLSALHFIWYKHVDTFCNSLWFPWLHFLFTIYPITASSV